jgi:hypothetical protein
MAVSQQADEIVQMLLVIYKELKSRQKSGDLGPCAETNKLFGELVVICIANVGRDNIDKVSMSPS